MFKFEVRGPPPLPLVKSFLGKTLIDVLGVSVMITEGHMSLVVRKPVFGVSDQVWHKPGCTATEDG